MYFETIHPNNWIGVRRNFQKIDSYLFGPLATPTFKNITVESVVSTGLTDNSLVYPVSGVLTSLGEATDGQIPIGDTDGVPILATITGTANEIDITNAAGSITLSLSESLSLSGATISGDLIPDTDGTYDIGSYDAEVEADEKDAYNTGDDGLFGIIDTQYWKGQTFTAGSNYDIGSVKLLMYKGGGTSPGTVTVSIRATTEYGAYRIPTEGDLAVGTIDGDDLTEDTDGEWAIITFDSAYSLVSGTVYAICVRCAGSNPDVIYLREDSGGGYASGNQCTSSDSGSTWAGAADDCMFETYAEGFESESFAIKDIYLTGDITDGVNATSAAEIAAAYAHVSSDGSDHTFIDQDVTIASTPTLGGLTTAGTIDASAGEVLVEDSDTDIPSGKDDGYIGVAIIGGQSRVYFAVNGTMYYIDGTVATVPVTGNPIGLLLALTYNLE